VKGYVSTMFRLDEDLSGFHRTASRSSRHRWIARHRAGRLLRAPTVFEDMVKMICTTNCTWSLTTIMVQNLVNALGSVSREGWRTFPDAYSVAGAGERFLRNEVKTGYRSPYLLELAGLVASGKLDPEQWRSSTRPPGETLKELLSVKGIGPYAAQNMLKLLGHYDFLALDSWVRSKYYSLYHRGRTVKDRTIESRYARYGRWKGLVFWMEMTKDWHDAKFSRRLPESGST
jgi:N-glycosylase/DNA lyase